MDNDSAEKAPPNLSGFARQLLQSYTNWIDGLTPIDYMASMPLETHAYHAANLEIVRWARYVLRNHADEN